MWDWMKLTEIEMKSTEVSSFWLQQWRSVVVEWRADQQRDRKVGEWSFCSFSVKRKAERLKFNANSIEIQLKFNWNSMISMRFPFISFRFWLKDFSLEAHRPCCSGTSPCFPGASQAGWHGAAAAAWRSSARRQTSFEDFLDNSIHSIKFTQRSLII